MRIRLPLRVFGLALLTVLSFAFASGTALRAAPQASDARLEVLQLMGFAVDDLCNDGQDKAVHFVECSLCNLVASSTLPDAGGLLVEVDRRIYASVILPQIRRAEARQRDPATPLRGPPQAA